MIMSKSQNISQVGINLIKHFEDCMLAAYWDKTGEVWTIGYGHTQTAKKGMVISFEDAENLLISDLSYREAQIRGLDLTLTQNQFDALVSFVYNVGIGNLRKSTLLRMLRKDAENFMIAYEFPKWRKSGGVILRGLERRRRVEAKLYFTGNFTGKGVA